METQMWAIGLMVLISVLSAVGNLFIKLASSKLSFNLKTILTNFKLFVGLTIFAVTTVLALVAYSGGELSVLYPFMAFQYVWVNLLSVKCFLWSANAQIVPADRLDYFVFVWIDRNLTVRPEAS